MIVTKHFSGAATAVLAHAGGNAILWNVIVNTGVASATVTIYNGVDTSGDVVATIDASAVATLWYGYTLSKGIYVVTTGTADVSVGYS